MPKPLINNLHEVERLLEKRYPGIREMTIPEVIALRKSLASKIEGIQRSKLPKSKKVPRREKLSNDTQLMKQLVYLRNEAEHR